MLSRSELIVTISEKTATHVFVMMLNPIYRGPKFNFQTFDIENHVAAGASMSFKRPLNTSEEQRVREIARLTWDKLVKSSGVLNWIDRLKCEET